MITYEYIFGLIITIGLLFQGFYLGRRQMVRLLIISLGMILSAIVSIIIHGVYTFDVTIYMLIIADIYVVFWWGVGYVLSGFTIIREKDIGVRAIKNIKGNKIKINLK